jgi:serine/threonine protein kinase
MERFGQYILLEKVATGGMAELFKAKKIGIEGFERVLAIKRILPHLSSDEEFIDMFIAEAKLVARLTHKNIAQVYDFGKIDQNYFIAMEYIRGKDLKGILKRCEVQNIKLPVALAVFIAKEVASALSYAHRQKDSMGKNFNIIHRDVSPQNILVSYEGDVKVVDFGIAKAGTHSKTTTGVLKGKLSYMSPEQAWGKPIDHRSDIFSLGIVLYEMLTGERLFKGDTEINTLERVRAAKVESFPSSINADLPSELDDKVLKALAKEVTDRYQDASSMEADLGDMLFKLSSPDPASSLKQFMHDQFEAEIEAGRKSEMQEETVSIQFAHEALADEMKSNRVETMKTAQGIQPPALIKRGLYPYVISASLVIVIIAAALMFWPGKPERTMSPAPVQSTVNTVGQSKSVTQIESGTKTESGTTTDKRQREMQKDASEEEIGGLTINAVPWANVYINGKARGTTPQTLEDLKAGTYKVRLQNPDFPVWETKVRISEGKTAKVSHRFEGFGKIIINATPWADVYLDGTLKGQTPLTIEKVSAGKHQIKVSREGFTGYSKTFEISEGATKRFSATLKKDG